MTTSACPRVWRRFLFTASVTHAIVWVGAATVATSGEAAREVPTARELRSRALAERPEHPALLYELAESVRHPAWELALRERAYHVVAESGHTGAVPALFAQRWLAPLLAKGLTHEALTVIESVPTAVRDAVEPTGRVEARLDGWPVEGEFTDLRMELAAACILESRVDLARQLVAEVAAEATMSDESMVETEAQDLVFTTKLGRQGQWRPPEFGEDGGRLAILQRHLEPSGKDPFDLLVGAMQAAYEPWLQSGTWRRLLASLAAREGYASYARYQHLQLALRLDPKWWPAPEVPDVARTPDLTSAASRATDAIDRLRVSLAEHSPTQATDGPVSGVDKTVQRLIAAPRIAAIAERPLRTPNVSTTREQENAHLDALRSEHKLPYPHQIIRIESRQNQVVALGASQDYDPVGELSRGAYWVLRSHDGGTRWEPPLYTGLRITMPYVATPVSKLRMIRRSGIRLEVEVRELDLNSITFPPLFTATSREKRGLFLEIPWELLERDSDGDGLTDLAEERLITDPHVADTDGDGLDDRADLLPQVPLDAGNDDRATLMQMILEHALGGPRAIVHEVGDFDEEFGADGVVRTMRGATYASERTGFFVGTRAHFRGVTPSRRVVVLSPVEHAAAERKFGPIFAAQIELLIVNRTGDLAFAVWSSRWRGGDGIFEKVDTEWLFNGGGVWVT